MKDSVKKSIESYLIGFLQGLINKYDPEVIKDEIIRNTIFDKDKGMYKPFHEALIPVELLRIQNFFRSFSTSLGQGVFEYIAKTVAEANPKWIEVKSNSKFTANSTPDIQSIVDSFLEDIIENKTKPFPYPEFPESNNANQKNIVVDLYLKDEFGKIYFFEIKSPKPNKDQTRRTKEKFLFLHASYPDARKYYALPYNPFGEEKEQYRWNFTTMFFDLEKEVLIGREFWDFIGGENTYHEILEIFRKVGKEKGKKITKRLIKGVSGSL